MSSGGRETLVRRGNFMTAPATGWLHNEDVLARGAQAGVFYSFPVRYIGSIQIFQSLSKLDIDQKTEICREAIWRCAVNAKILKSNKNKLPKALRSFIADKAYVAPQDLKINLSTSGIATSAIENKEIKSFDALNKISFAAGGDGPLYDFITYVAKDKRDNRYCHVFDCAILSDDVLATLGQIFTIIRKPQNAPSKSSTAHSDPVGNPMYFDTHPKPPPVPGNHPSMRRKKEADPAVVAQPAQLEYGDEQLYEETPDAPPPRPPAASVLEMYEDMTGQGAANDPSGFVSFLNEQHQSQHLYGEITAAADANLYGDGEVGWNYLDVKPEPDMYGTLADLALS